MKLRDSEFGYCVSRDKAKYCVWVKYDKQKDIREVEINPVTGNGYYPLDRTYKILGKKIKRVTWDDEWRVSSTKVFRSLNQLPDCENFSYVDEEAYDGRILKAIFEGNSLEQIAREFQDISLGTKEYEVKRNEGADF